MPRWTPSYLLVISLPFLWITRLNILTDHFVPFFKRKLKAPRFDDKVFEKLSNTVLAMGALLPSLPTCLFIPVLTSNKMTGHSNSTHVLRHLTINAVSQTVKYPQCLLLKHYKFSVIIFTPNSSTELCHLNMQIRVKYVLHPTGRRPHFIRRHSLVCLTKCS
jgi:hypothetical protein